MMVHNTLQIGLVDIGRGLGLIRVIHEIEIDTGHTIDHTRGRQTETIQNESRLRSGFSMSYGLNIKASTAVEISAGQSRNNAIGIGVL